jgi:ubiquinone/menaquinone biosynthesis C-methylase UbiE
MRKLHVLFDAEPTLVHKLNYKVAETYIRGKKVLDVGCWSGQFEKLAVEKVGSITGIDPDRYAIAYAKKFVPKAKFVVGEVGSLPFPDKSFDVVIFSEVIEHIPENTEDGALKEISRVLKPKGILILTTPQRHLLSIILDPAYFISGHRHYSMDELESLLKRNKFEIFRKFTRGNIYQSIDSNLKLIGKHLLNKSFTTPRWVQKKIKEGYLRGGFIGIHIISKKTK